MHLSKKENKLVVRLGSVTQAYASLSMQLRKVFEPNVAHKLKEERAWKLKDYLHLGRQFGVSHVFALSQSDSFNNMKVVKADGPGPTYHFKVKKYLLMDALAKSGERYSQGASMHGIMILSSEIGSDDPIHSLVEDLKENNKMTHLTSRALVIKKCASGDYLFVHYVVKKEEKGGASNLVKLSLREVGPRIEAQLQKIEEGMCTGRVLYHAYLQKTSEEVAAVEKRLRERREEKEKRKLQQELNVEGKKARRSKKSEEE